MKSALLSALPPALALFVSGSPIGAESKIASILVEKT